MNYATPCSDVRASARYVATQTTISLLLLASAALWQPVSAQTDNPLLYELMDRIELLEREVRQLRGELEVLQYRRQQQTPISPAPVNTAPRASLPPPAVSTSLLPPPPRPITTTQPPKTPSVTPGGNEQSDYDTAFNHLRSGQYEQAVSQFEDFLRRYPGSSLRPDAYYWLGESYYVLRRFDQAQQIFLTLGAEYPSSEKLPDAMLKLGYIYSETGDITQAREMLEKLIAVYPNSVAASLGETHLRSLR